MLELMDIFWTIQLNILMSQKRKVMRGQGGDLSKVTQPINDRFEIQFIFPDFQPLLSGFYLQSIDEEFDT